MNEKHWNNNRLIGHLYGTEPADAHLASCGECAAKVETMRETRRSSVAAESVAAENDIPADFLVAQRQRIAARIEGSRGWSFGWVQALGVAATLLMAVLLSTPAPEPMPMMASAGSAVVSLDAELFAEISEMVESAEPRAAEPIRALFSEELP